MAEVLSNCVTGPHISLLLRPKFDCSRRVALAEQSPVCSLRCTTSGEYHSPLSLGYSRSNRLLTAYAVNSVCWLVVCLLLLDVPVSPFVAHCHFFASLTLPGVLRTGALTQPGGLAYETRNSRGPTAPGQAPSEYVPSYPSYTDEQYNQQQLPPTSPSELQGGDAYEQKTQEQPSTIQEQSPPSYEQGNHEQEPHAYPSASSEQGPFNNYEKAPAGVTVDNEAHASTIPKQHEAATYGQKEAERAERSWPKIREEPTKAVKLEKHSWTSPLNYETTLAEWDFTMAAVPVQHHVVLVPAVAHRVGQFWHRSPLLTANFEVQFAFAVSGDETISAGQQPLRGKGFAFWYVYEAYDKPVPKAATNAGDTSLFGYHSRPRGLGIFFKVYDKQGNPRPSISALYQENGEDAVDALNDVPVPGGIFFRYRNLKEPILFKVAAGPLGVVGELRTSAMASWLRCFDLKGVQLRPGGFLGFTASNSAESTASDEASVPQQRTGNADLIVLKFVKVWNFNLSAKGEENINLERALGPGVHLEDILKLHSAHKDQRELADALRQLARLIYKHIIEHTPREEAMQQRLTSLSEQLSRLESQVAQWRTELQAAIGKTGQVARAATGQGADDSPASATDRNMHALHSVSSELYGMRDLLAKHSQLHRESIESLKKKVDAARVAGHSAALPELRELANRTKDIEASLAAKEQFSFLTMIGLIFLLLSFALFVWKRFRDMEKKHLL